MTQQYDLVIIGGGIAGMTAALYAGRAHLRTCILENAICGGLVNSTYVVENMPSYPAVHGMELMERTRDQVAALGVDIEEVCDVQEMDLESPIKEVRTAAGVFRAPGIILATGRKPIPLEVDGAEDSRQVHSCAVCDGSAYSGKHVLVVGGGNSGFDEARYLVDLGVASLTLVETMPRFFATRSAQEALLAHPHVTAFHSTCLQQLHHKDGKLVAVTLKHGTACRELPVDGVFVFMGQTPNTAGLQGRLQLDAQGYIVTDSDMATSIPGVYAAGDVRSKQFRQITTAMSDGTIAALCVERHIRRENGACA